MLATLATTVPLLSLSALVTPAAPAAKFGVLRCAGPNVAFATRAGGVVMQEDEDLSVEYAPPPPPMGGGLGMSPCTIKVIGVGGGGGNGINSL